MGYSDFTLKKVKHDFQLVIIEDQDMSSQIEAVDISEFLSQSLSENVPLALAINTEKARSELIIVQILLEIRKRFNHQISFFSGIALDVDQERNLNGFCDYVISRSPEQLFLSEPIITIVEAKNENIVNGYGQCISEMIALRIFNEREGNPASLVYSVITTGSIWKFLKLENNDVYIDVNEYHISSVKKIVGILSAMIKHCV